MMKSLIVCYSYHHHNTEKIANAIAAVLEAEVKTPQQINPAELAEYDLIGLGSGIYGSSHHQSLLDLADNFPQGANGKTFLFSTCGVPAFTLEQGEVDDYVEKSHAPLKTRLQTKGYAVVDEFICPGLNTNSFLKFFGGLNKGRPDAKDVQHAEQFAERLKAGKTFGAAPAN